MNTYFLYINIMLTVDIASLAIIIDKTYPGFYLDRLYNIKSWKYGFLFKTFIKLPMRNLIRYQKDFSKIEIYNTNIVERSARAGYIEIFKHWLKLGGRKSVINEYYKRIWYGNVYSLKWVRTRTSIPDNIMLSHAVFGGLEEIKYLQCIVPIDREVFIHAAICGHINIVEWLYGTYTIDYDLLLDISCNSVIHMVKWVYKKHPELFDEAVWQEIKKNYESIDLKVEFGLLC